MKRLAVYEAAVAAAAAAKCQTECTQIGGGAGGVAKVLDGSQEGR